MALEKWIALAEVTPTAACRDLDCPAFVNVIGMATNKDSFVDLIRTECERLNLQLVNVDDIERWRERIANWQPDDDVIALAESVWEQNPFAFDTFVCFEE